MNKPIRIQQRRAHGWCMPPNTMSVARSTRFGNHVIKVAEAGSHAAATEMYRRWVFAPAKGDFRARVRRELRSKNLACYCPLGQPCHADVLLEIANSEQPAE
jgi:Domain of unknown function (DUF4326)